MKPAPFYYSRPESLAEALQILQRLGGEGKVLAGGQSLLPLLSMRLAEPHHLVDINRLPGLDYVDCVDGEVRVGALARHAAVLADDAAAQSQPLLRQALGNVAHATIRNRGTTVGSIVHADPSGEMTAVLAVLYGSVLLRSAGGQRLVPAAEFFLGPLESAVTAQEIAVEARFPQLAPGAGTAFVEVARRQGDYAVCGVAAIAFPDGSARVGLLSVGPTPVVLDVPADPQAAAQAVRDGIDPEADIHASADYRRHLAGELTARALDGALNNASAGALR